MTAEKLMHLPPANWQEVVEGMTEREKFDAMQALEGIAVRAAQLSAYVEKQGALGHVHGHYEALKACNRAGRVVHCNAQGYNEYTPLNF